LPFLSGRFVGGFAANKRTTIDDNFDNTHQVAFAIQIDPSTVHTHLNITCI